MKFKLSKQLKREALIKLRFQVLDTMKYNRKLKKVENHYGLCNCNELLFMKQAINKNQYYYLIRLIHKQYRQGFKDGEDFYKIKYHDKTGIVSEKASFPSPLLFYWDPIKPNERLNWIKQQMINEFKSEA